jgi:periplasmic copper chaperone A
MTRTKLTISVVAVALFTPAIAYAHVSVASGPALANVSQEVTFGVGHGCAGADTISVDIEIPEGVTSIRPMTSDFGQIDMMTDAAGLIVMVSWTKPEADLLEADTQYYKLVLRMRPPDQPFATLLFPAHQTCQAADGTITVVDWVAPDESDPEIEPAPALFLIPQKFPGWNRWTVSESINDLSLFFGDAEIVWRDNAAYSINPTTTDLIGATEGVTALDALGSGDEIWVKY